MRAKIVRESLHTDDYYENILNESILNEKFDLNTIKQTVSQITDKKAALFNFVKKFNKTHNLSTKKYIGTLIVLIFLSNFAIKNNKWSGESSMITSDAVEQLVKQDKIDLNDISNAVELNLNDVTKLTNASNLEVSNDGINLIKHHEGLRLKGYDIKDGKITIGYGHTGDDYNVGEEISKIEAEQLFKKDLEEATNGVKRIFKQWESSGIDRKISQSMYDSMVSLTFNIGINGLRMSDFIQDIKSGDYETASEKILSLKISDKFPGLKRRRAAEYELFNKDIS